MKNKHLSVVAGAVLLFPMLAHAQPHGGSAEVSAWGTVFWTIFPMVIVMAFVVIFIRKAQKPILKHAREHRERHVQHMERVEQSLDRITKLLEKRD